MTFLVKTAATLPKGPVPVPRKLWTYAAAIMAKLKVLAPYAMIELILPGGSLMALLLWLYRRHGAALLARREPTYAPLVMHDNRGIQKPQRIADVHGSGSVNVLA